jgi:hypothetical protein
MISDDTLVKNPLIMADNLSDGSKNASWPQFAAISQKLTSRPFFFRAWVMSRDWTVG